MDKTEKEIYLSKTDYPSLENYVGDHLIVTDGLDTHGFEDLFAVVLACGNHGDTRTREGDFGGRAEENRHILVSCFLAGVHDIEQLVGCIGYVMDAICVIPHDGKVRSRRLQCCHAGDRLVGVDDTIGIGILGNTPNTLYCRVFDIFLYKIHIRSFRCR